MYKSLFKFFNCDILKVLRSANCKTYPWTRLTSRGAFEFLFVKFKNLIIEYKYFYIIFGWLIFSSAFAEGRLIFAIDLVRHGDRTPVIESPGIDKLWPQGLGQLTPKGMNQEYELGKSLRLRYVNEYHLLPKHYDVNFMSVRSSNLARTMMSAQSILYGLYPLGTGPLLNNSKNALPKGMQPIPINTVACEQDSLLLANHNKKMYEKLLKTYIFNSQDWIQRDQALKSNYPLWSKFVGVKISSLFDLIQVSDRFFIERLYKIPPPAGLEAEDVDRIIDEGNWAFLKILNHPKLAWAIGTELAEMIKSDINSAKVQNRKLKYKLFVAHDTTLAYQLKILGQEIKVIPPYASVINYSVFDNGSENYEVRVTYNQKPLFIKQCGGYSCTLNKFIKFIDEKLLAG